MTDTRRAVGFLLVMVTLMPAYLYVPTSSVASGLLLTLLAPAAMALYLGNVAFWRPAEAPLQSFWLVGAITMTSGAAAAAIAWEYGAVLTYRSMTFGLHAMAWTGLAIWWWLRPGEGRSFLTLIALAWGLQTFNAIEFGLCNWGAPAPSADDIHGSVCVRSVGSPLYLLVPIVVVTSSIVVASKLWRR